MNYEKVSREHIEKAVVRLVSGKRIDQISVQQILDEAGVSRQTFYNYFRDKYDVVLYHYKMTVESTLLAYRDKEPWNRIVGIILEIILSEKQFYRQAFRYCRENPLHDEITRYMADSYIDEIMLRMATDHLDEDLKFEIKYNAYAATECMLEWFDSGMKEDPYRLADNVIRCMPDVMKQVFGLKQPSC